MTETVADTRWYAIQTYSGHENKVQRLIERRIEDELGEEGDAQEIRVALVPTREVTEIRNGKRVNVTKRLYPGYVLVEMVLNQRTQYVINNIQGVIKFVGQGRSPQPLRDEEINKLLGVEVKTETADREEVLFHVDQVVEVRQGPFTDFSGTVQEVYANKWKFKVEISLCGRARLHGSDGL